MAVKKVLLGSLTALALVGVIGGVIASGTVGPSAVDAEMDGTVGDAPWSQTFQYTGSVQYVTVPPNVDEMTVSATGGDGGYLPDVPISFNFGPGAVVTGTIAVTPGQKVAIEVGGVGQDGSTSKSDPRGGWGGLGYNGGNGKGESDHLRASGGGGGASTVQLADGDGSNQQTLVVAAGGGGDGGASGDPVGAGLGGDAGTAWSGQKGEDAGVDGGKGGQLGGGSGGAGGNAGKVSGDGGDGGGGGGGVAGGGGGTGGKLVGAGGGGASGSSMAASTMSSTAIAQRFPNGIGASDTPANGVVTITWTDA